MKWALINEDGMVVNIIAYDGKAPYRPADGLSLVEVNDWVEIGEHKDADKKPSVVEDPADVKRRRDKELAADLSLKATFRIEKRSNPSLTFSEYLDQLEAQRV